MAVVRVVTDSSCDLPTDVVQKHGITVVPLSIRFGEEEFVDGRDLTPSAFWARSAASAVLPSTAAPSPGAFEQAFRDAAAGGADGVVCINLSSKLSATIQAAETAAKAVAGEVPVRIVDSKSVSLGLGTICIAAAEAGAGGAVGRRGGRPGRGHGPPHQDPRHPRHPREPEEGRAHRGGQGPAGLDPVGQAGDRGGRRGGRARTQGADPVQGAPVPGRQGRGRAGRGEPGRPPRRRPRRRPVPRAARRPTSPGRRSWWASWGPSIGSHTGPRTIGVAFQVCPTYESRTPSPSVVPATSLPNTHRRALPAPPPIAKGGMAEVWEARRRRARTLGGGQGPPPPAGRRPVLPRALPAGGDRRRPPGPPQRGGHLRHRRRRRPRPSSSWSWSTARSLREVLDGSGPLPAPGRPPSRPRWRPPSTTPTGRASSTATSSRPTS